jgi:hypothetical protein
MSVRQIGMIAVVFIILALALGVSIGSAFFGSKTISIIQTRTISSNQTIFKVVSSAPSSTITVTAETIEVGLFTAVIRIGCSTVFGYGLNYNSTTFLAPHNLPTQFYAVIVTISNMTYSGSETTVTTVNSSLVIVYNIQSNTTQTLLFTATC